ISAFLVRAGDIRALFLAVLREQVRLPALRARTGNGPVPRRELAVRIVHAAPEALAEAALALRQPAATVGADDALQRNGPRRLAGRIVAAGEEPAEPAAFVDHRLAASGADLVGGDVLD